MGPSAIAEVTERLDSFAGACTFLSRLFLLPAEERLLAAVADASLLADWPLRRDELTTEGLALLHQAACGPERETVADLDADYQTLFVGPGHVLACPYESVYLSDEHLIFEQQTLSVRTFYADFGVQAPELNKEPDDHIGLELSFIAHLCVLGMDAVDVGSEDDLATVLEAIGRFVREHLLLWGFDCLERLEAGAQTRFYRGLGLLAQGSLRQLAASFAP